MLDAEPPRYDIQHRIHHSETTVLNLIMPHNLIRCNIFQTQFMEI